MKKPRNIKSLCELKTFKTIKITKVLKNSVADVCGLYKDIKKKYDNKIKYFSEFSGVK